RRAGLISVGGDAHREGGGRGRRARATVAAENEAGAVGRTESIRRSEHGSRRDGLAVHGACCPSRRWWSLLQVVARWDVDRASIVGTTTVVRGIPPARR